MRNSLNLALELSRRGLSVIPVPRPDAHHDGKRPAIAWKEYQENRATEADLREWFSVERNVGVVTGAISGVVVIDADSPEAVRWTVAHLPRTPWQTRTARGIHAWYRHPGVPVRNCARIDTREGRLAIDVRGDGGFVIAPGSLHASGHVYQAAGDWHIPKHQLPVFWLGWLVRAEPLRQNPPSPATKGATRDVIERARRYLSAIPVPIIGQGSDAAVFSAACRLVRGFGIAEADSTALLWAWAGNRPGWTERWIAGKVRSATLYGSEPVGHLR